MKANEQHRNEIALSYSAIGDGETSSGEICPACAGGDSQEKSLSVTRRGNSLLFICHRSSCYLRGAVSLGGMPTLGETPRSLDRKTSYPRVAAEQLNAATAKFLATRYRIPAESVEFAGLGWTGDANWRYGRRVAMPIYGPNSKERGVSYRSYEGVAPKTITELKDGSESTASWYKWLRKSDTLIIVEDQISAIKLAPYVHSLALLGTHMNEDLAKEIAAQGYKTVLICLDNDATYTAIKMQLMWKSTIKGLLVNGLGKDIKDMNDNEFQEYLQHTELLPYEPVSHLDLPGFDSDDIPF